jgi:hypothetical protein
MGAPDSPVCHRTSTMHCSMRRHVTQPLGFGAKSTVGDLSSCGTGQSGATLDSPVPHWTVRCALTSRLWLLPRHCSRGRYFCSRPLALDSRCPLAHRTVRWIIAERAFVFPRVAGWHLDGPGAPDTVRWHTGQFGAPFFRTLKSFGFVSNESLTWIFYWFVLNLMHL